MDYDKKKDEIVDIFDKRKYEQYFSVCKKLGTFIKKKWLKGTSPSFQNKTMIMPRMNTGKYNASEISNGDDKIADVWNEHNTEQVPDRKGGKY